MNYEHMRIIPAGHRILIKVLEPEEKTKGGIILTAKAVDEDRLMNDVGEVIAIGPTAFDVYGGREVWGIKEGQKVMFVRYGGRVVKFPGWDEKVHGLLRIVNDEDIIAVVEEAN